MKYLRLLVIVSIILFGTSCSKEDEKWKLPTDVSFKMDVNRSSLHSGQLNFTGGTFNLTEFEIEGVRMQSDDIYFQRSFGGGTTISLNNIVIPSLDFDIPQGTYTKIEIAFEAEGNGGNSITVNGSYTNSSSNTYPLLLEIKEVDLYSVIAKNGLGNSQIILSEDIASQVRIELDPVYWFQSVSTTILDSATLVNVAGVPTILINDAYNGNILDIVNDQIDKGTDIVFE